MIQFMQSRISPADLRGEVLKKFKVSNRGVVYLNELSVDIIMMKATKNRWNYVFVFLFLHIHRFARPFITIPTPTAIAKTIHISFHIRSVGDWVLKSRERGVYTTKNISQIESTIATISHLLSQGLFQTLT